MFDNEITFVFGPPTTADAEEVVKKWTQTKEAEEWWQTNKLQSSSLPFIGMKRIFLFYEIYW